MLIKDMDLHKIYCLEEVLEEEGLYQRNYDNLFYYYPDGSPIALWIYKTNDYVYITDKGVTTEHWLNSVCYIESDPKYYMIPSVIDSICEYLDVSYQDSAFFVEISLEELKKESGGNESSEDHLSLFEVAHASEMLYKAIYIVSTLLES